MSPRRTIVEQHTFLGYCRTLALGRGQAASMAKVVLLVGAAEPSWATRKTEKDLRSQRINYESYHARMEAIEWVARQWKRGVNTAVVNTVPGDWEDMGEGRHRRQQHIPRGNT